MPDISSWVLGAATLALGAVLTLGVEVIRRQWAKKDAAENDRRAAESERRQRIEQRSEEAAEKLLETFQGLWDLYLHGLSRGEKASKSHVAVIHGRIAHIGDANARALLEQVESVLNQADILEAVHGASRTVIVRVATRTGHDVAGAVLRGESIPNPPSELSEYTAAMDEHWSAMDESRNALSTE